MGNTASVGPSASGALDSYVAELGDGVVYEQSLGYTRLLKSVKARHANGPLVVKFFIKPDPSLSLRHYNKRLKVEREALHDIPNVHSHQVFAETEKAGYLVRQWLSSSLYDRISTRPFLTTIEKKWISYQILQALRDAAARAIPHGDLKSSNILVTSWNWVYVTDFASSYKPTYLPLNDPADFSFFFDTAGRRTCYVAPERFYDAEPPPVRGQGKKGNVNTTPVLESMDVFSAGCVIAELWLDGEALFTLSGMFKYRSGETQLDTLLDRISDPGVRSLLDDMMALNPSKRPTFDALLQSSRGTLFPESFYSFLHNYISSVNELRNPTPFSHTRTDEGNAARRPLPSDSDHRLDRIWNEFDSVESYLFVLPNDGDGDDGEESYHQPRVEYKGDAAGVGTPYQDILPVALHLANREPQIHGISPIPFSVKRSRSSTGDSPALIFLSLVLSNLRNASVPSSKLHGMDVLLALSAHLDDEARLDRILPYLVDSLRDDEAIVRLSGLRTLVQMTCTVTTLTPSNALVYPEYILPNMRHLCSDPEVSVRCAYAQLIATVAETAVRFLEIGQALRMHGTFGQSDQIETEEQWSYDSNLNEIQAAVQEQLSILLADPHSSVKRAVLHNVSSLCIFLGRLKTNDLLLSHMITYLNDRDWMLRYAFFEGVVDVAAVVGSKALESYILPLMIQAVSDSEEAVVAKVLASFTTLAELGLFSRMRVWELMSATLAFLFHPNIWVRQGAAAFISSATKNLPATDTWAILYPSLKYYLRSDIAEITEDQLLEMLKAPLPRQIFDAAVSWAMRSTDAQFWKPGAARGRSPEHTKEAMIASRKNSSAATRTTVIRSEEDEQQLVRLRQLGMTLSDEGKLVNMRDYVIKHALAITSASSRLKSDNNSDKLATTTTIGLQKLGVVPRTVFLASRTSETHGRHFKLSDVRSPQPPMGRRASFSSNSIRPSERVPHVVDDLRRQLAAINTSTTSLSRDRRDSTSASIATSHSPSVSTPPASTLPTDGLVRPVSPVESTHSVSLAVPTVGRPHRSRAPLALTDSHKAAPAIASTKTNVAGLLEQSVDLRSNPPTVSMSSGRTSPISVAGTIRADQNPTREELQVPTSQGLLDKLYQEHDTNRDASHDFGPRVREAPLRRRTNIRQTFASKQKAETKDGSELIATLTPHAGAVNGIAIAPDHCFFVSASDDKTVKVWDAARLERNVTSKPRQIHTLHRSRVTAVCMLEELYCFASAGENGSIHVVRVHLTHGGSTPKYGKLKTIREHQLTNPGEYATCLTHFFADTHSKLIYATTQGNVTILELATDKVQMNMSQPRHFGPISCLCLDRKRTWLATGTLTGVMTIWDIRFGILLKSWRIGKSDSRITQCSVHPTKGQGKWVMLTVERKQGDGAEQESETRIEVWDIEEARLVEVFKSQSEKESNSSMEYLGTQVGLSLSPGKTNTAKAIQELLDSKRRGEVQVENIPPVTSQSPFLAPESDRPIRFHMPSCFLTGLDIFGLGAGGPNEVIDFNADAGADDFAMPISTKDSGFLLTGSHDCRVRFWDLEHLERSKIMCGADAEDDSPVYRTTDTPAKVLVHSEIWGGRRRSKRVPPRNSLVSGHQQELGRAHQELITALGCIQFPFRGGIITGDRFGALKVWRVETI